MNTLSVLVCRPSVTHNFTISAQRLLPKFIPLLLSLNWELLIPVMLFTTKSPSVLWTDGKAETELWSSFHQVMQQDSNKTKNKCHGLTTYLWDSQIYKHHILHHSSYLRFKSKDSYRDFCLPSLYIYIYYSPSYIKDFKFILPFGFVLNSIL